MYIQRATRGTVHTHSGRHTVRQQLFHLAVSPVGGTSGGLSTLAGIKGQGGSYSKMPVGRRSWPMRPGTGGVGRPVNQSTGQALRRQTPSIRLIAWLIR